MLTTLVAAALTVIGFIIGQVSEGAYKWDEDLGSTLEYTSGFLTGVYGMWNLYIFGLIFLYAPSHKKWGNEDTVSTGNLHYYGDPIEKKSAPGDHEFNLKLCRSIGLSYEFSQSQRPAYYYIASL
jgi:hypothetical protein